MCLVVVVVCFLFFSFFHIIIFYEGVFVCSFVRSFVCFYLKEVLGRRRDVRC